MTSAHCAVQHALTPLCYFTWSTTSWLNCCCSQFLPLCYNTTNSWNIYQQGNFMDGLIAQVTTYHGTTLEFTELLRGTNSFTNVCRSSLH
ncbi:unnamed protein product, partial [Staurois parvus]